MLKELRQIFRRQDVVRELTGMVDEMLQAGRWMFVQASGVLMRDLDWHELADPLYQRDRTINRLEQTIRQRLVAHLTVDNRADTPDCLVLMSVVKDAERIGDYCKNIFEVGRFYDKPFQRPEYREPLAKIGEQVTELFDTTRKAFAEGKEGAARTVLQQSGALGTQCDTIIEQLLRMQGEFPADEAVAYVLLARHFKRVARHLSNVATSVVAPVHKLDFFDE